MAKRQNSPQQIGDRKKPRLDISVSDHNFPLSQNAGSNAPDQNDNWGDDIDDEILLQASQACEQECNSSVLPEYSQFRPPVETSTQRALPSTNSGTFSFKRPSTSSTNTVSTRLKDKCERISSPLRGISTNIQTDFIDLTGNYYNEPVLNTKDTDNVYRQLLQLKEENANLKSENGKLLEKCVTKEGESSILRTQLKTYQVAVDNARLEKLRTQEQMQQQWSMKLNAVNTQLHDLRTQLDFKNLEVINMKEKCKMLESNKIKLTQINIGGNDMASHRLNNSAVILSNVAVSQLRRHNTATSSVQTDNTPQFLKLTKSCRLGKSKLAQILPLIMDSATDQQHSILDYNEKLKNPTDISPNKCRIFSTFHKLLSSTNNIANKVKNKMNLSCIYEDLTCIAACNNDVEKNLDHYIKVFNMTKSVLEDVQSQLEMVTRRITSAFQKEMDKKYLECTAEYIVVNENDLIGVKALYNEEQAILARRMTAVLQSIVREPAAALIFNKHQHTDSRGVGCTNYVIELLQKICTLLDNSSCGVLYSGFLLSILLLIENLTAHSQLNHQKALNILKRVVSSRAMLFVPCSLLRILNKIKDIDNSVTLCSENGGNLKVDYDQGVLLYKKESCLLQVLLKQVESSLKCMEKQNLPHQVIETTQCLMHFYCNHNSSQSDEVEKHRCECNRLLMQIIVYALNICSTMLCNSTRSTKTENTTLNTEQAELLRVCRSGLQILYQCTLKDVEFSSQLSYNEGNLIEFCERMKGFDHNEFHSIMLSELIGSFQAVAEEASSFHRHAWLRSFESFSLAD